MMVNIGDRKIIVDNPYVEITTKCNLHCPYCFNDSGMQDYNQDMSMDIFKAILNELLANKIYNITISGGEPLLHKQIKDFFSMLFENNIKVTLITNGTIYNNDILDMLVRNDVKVQLTIDGPTESHNSFTRGKKTLSKNQFFINYFRSRNKIDNIIIRINISCYSDFDLDQMIDFLNEMSIENYYFSYIKDIGRASDCKNAKDTLLSYVEQLNKLGHIQQKMDHLVGVSFDPKEGCPYASKSLISSPRIDCQGNIYPCSLFVDSSFILGNILSEGISKTFTGAGIKAFLSYVDEVCSAESCKKCYIEKICKRCCPAQVNRNTYIDDYCDIRRMIFKCRLREEFK